MSTKLTPIIFTQNTIFWLSAIFSLFFSLLLVLFLLICLVIAFPALPTFEEKRGLLSSLECS